MAKTFLVIVIPFISKDNMYLLKVKGSARIPDYIQIRDSQFTLIAYFRADHFSGWIQQSGLTEKEIEIKKIIAEIPYGKIFRLPF